MLKRVRQVMNKLFFVFFFCTAVFADPLNNSLELNTSVSHAYDARSTFSNPSALGFQTELNEAAPLSSFSYATNRQRRNEFSLAFSYGYFGFGLERLNGSPSFLYTRYSFALGVPLSAGLYVGSRFSTTSSDAANLNGVHALDFGLQYRPSRFWSVGLQMNKINRPTVFGVQTPVQYVAGVSLSPADRLMFSFDVDTQSDRFAKNFGYKGMASFEVFPGLSIDAGYHQDYKFMAGVQFNLANAKIFGYSQPSSDARNFSVGFQSGATLRRSILQPQTALKVVIDDQLSEEGSSGNLLMKGRPSLIQVLNALEEARKDPHLKLVIVKIESFPLGLGAAQDLFDALMRLREEGRQIEVFLGNASAKEYLIASVGTKIHMESSGELRFLGPKSERYYAKGVLDKIGAEAELIGRGEYKSAPETFTRKEASPANKEATLHELKSMEAALVSLLSKSRKKIADWKALTQHALFSAEDALSQKLVDSVDRANEEMEKLSHQYIVRENTHYQVERLNLPPRVSVIVADGTIMQNKVRLLSLTGGIQVTPEKMQRRFKYALNDRLTKAIVLRVTSPGGEILASQEIADIIQFAKTKKPVVVSMGDVAASGGYMISAPATRIFANSLSVTGSVGVFLGKVNLEGLLKKIDLRKEIVSSAPYAGILSESRSWTSEERALMIRRLNQYYESFVGFVANERKISKEEAEKAAKGRVWLGVDAKRLKLIDELGGLHEALHFAAHQAGIGTDTFEVNVIRENYGPFALPEDDLLLSKELGFTETALSLIGPKTLTELVWMARLSQDPFLYWAPETSLQ